METDTGIQTMFKDRYGDLNIIEDGVGHLKITTYIYNKGVPEPKDKHVFRIGEGKNMKDNKVNLIEIRKMLENNIRRKLAITWEKPDQLESFREIIEEVMDGSNIMVSIHTPYQTKKETSNQDEKRANSRNNEETIIIKPSGEGTYATILKEVKEEVISKGLEGNVQTVRETKKGEILITLKKGVSKTVNKLRKH